MAVEFDPSQPFQVVEGETLDSLIAPRPRAPGPVGVSAPNSPPVGVRGPVFDPAQPFTSVPDSAPGPVFDPSAPVIKVYGLEEFTAKPAEELVADKDFMPIEFGKQFETDLDPAQRTKLEQVYAARESSGTSVADKVRSAFTGIFPAVKTLASGVKSAAKLAEKFTPVGVAQRLIEKSPQEVINDYAKSGTEAAASVELAALGSTDLLRRSARAVGEAAGLLPGDLPALAAASGVPVRKSKADMTEGDWRKRLSDDIAAARQVEIAGQGNGEVMQGLGIDAATLEKDFGIVVDPEEIARLSVVTDPINYIPLGATVGWVGKIGGKFSRGAIAATRSTKQAQELSKILNTASQAASVAKSGAAQVAGGVAKTVGGAIEAIGGVAEKGIRALGGTASGVGLGGLLGGNVYSALGGAAVAKGVPRITQAAGRAISGTGRILTGEAVAPAALTLAGDTLKAGTAGALKGAAEGGILILPFEIGARPEEEEQLLGMVGLGAGLRAGVEGVRPAGRAAGRAAQNKLAETIFQRVEQEPLSESPTYGTDPLLDSTHSANVSKLAPTEQKLVNWGRELLRAAGGEVYVLDSTSFNRETGSKTAHGYAVNIGEKIAPDGSATPVFRILLNQSSEAMPHEFFHALTDLDPKRASDFRDTVKASLTPDQLKSFEQLYNARLNNGLPEVQWTKRLTLEQVVNEAAAETFSRLFLAQDLTGVAPKVQQKAALFVSSLLEKLGAPLGKVGAKAGEAGVSTLGIRPGAESAKAGQAWIANMLERVNDEGTLGQPPIAPERPINQTPIPADVVSRKPATVKATPVIEPSDIATALRKAGVSEKAIAQHLRETGQPPAPTVPPVNPPLPAVSAPAARNIRTTRAAQDDFAGQRAEVTNVEPARAAAEAIGDANTIARVSEISDLIESGSPVIEIEHSGARSTEQAAGRTTRRAEQEAAYIAEGMGAAPESIREAYQKVFVPVRWEVIAGKPQLLAMSLDKVIANAHKAVKESAARGVEARIPYEITDGRLTDNAWGQFVDDLKAYAENQSNGYRGDGQKLTRPTTDVGLSIPAENPAYNPRPITEERANFINLVQGLNPPLTAREGRQSSAIVPGNVKGQILAEANLRTPERPSVIRPEDITKQEFKSQPGRSIAETNPLRNELAAAGVPVRELIEVTERINARDINSVRPRPELDFRAPVTDTIRGGFLPGDTASAIADVLKMDATAFNAAAKSWDGGQRNRAYDLGLSTKSLEEVQLLRDAQEAASADRKRFMAARDIDNGVSSALKAQFFREAYEAATDTGGAAGAIGWRQAFPDREAPFPETVRGEFLPGVETEKALKNGQIEDPRPNAPNADEPIRRIAASYASEAGIDTIPHTGYDQVNPELARRIADFYDAATDSPTDPAVQASYQALADETLAQYQAIKDAGYVIEPFTGSGEPYKSSADMVDDVRDNKHLFVLPTEGNFAGAASNPLLQPGPDGLLVNDVFRAVHDFFGHAKEGYQFGPRGEFNAWKAHSTMFSPEAQGSLAAETLAQNLWVNYGKHLKEGTPLKDRPFAEQKNVIVPSELIDEARGDFLPTMAELEAKWAKEEKNKAKAPKQSKANPTAWILPDGEVKSISTAFHEQDLSKNRESFNKRFGTNFSAEASPQDRFGALDKGFVRIRYTSGNGRMAVEVGTRHWTRQKARVLDTLLSHSEKIDTLAINLIDENGQAADSVADKVFDAENKAEAITDLVNEIRPPKAARAKGVGPSDIQRMRALPGEGDFLPGNVHDPRTERGRELLDRGFTFRTDPDESFQINVFQGDKKIGEVRGYELSKDDKRSQRVEDPSKRYGKVTWMKVDEALQGQGIGEALLREFLAQGQSLGWKKLVGGAISEGGKRVLEKAFDEISDADFRELDDSEGSLGDGGIERFQYTIPSKRQAQFLPSDAPMLDLGLPSEERMKQLRVKTRVSKARENFPEAIAPQYQKDAEGGFVLGEDGKPKPVVQEYLFMETPLAREAAKGERGEAREEAFTDALSKKLVSAAKQAVKNKDIQAGAKWYSTTRSRLRGLLGDDTKFFSELLGATSARTPVDTNFRFAVDAYNQFKAGEYDGIIRKYQEGKTAWDQGQIADFVEATGNENPNRGQFLDWWVETNDLKPTQSNGKLFGMNSRSLLRVLDGSWRDEVQGPKTPNFAGNLSGDTFEATIDVWAARLLHRLSNEGNTKRWRVLPENETGVTDADFALGQTAFRKAADKLDMKPDSLQAILWFAEKDLWEKNGWTRGAGAAKSDFQSLLADTERTEAGQLRRKTPQNELAFPMEPGDIQRR